MSDQELLSFLGRFKQHASQFTLSLALDEHPGENDAQDFPHGVSFLDDLRARQQKGDRSPHWMLILTNVVSACRDQLQDANGPDTQEHAWRKGWRVLRTIEQFEDFVRHQ